MRSSARRATLGALSALVFALAIGTTPAAAATGGWHALTSGTTRNLNAVLVLLDNQANPSEIWAVGDGGTVLRSTNSGASFTAINAGTTQNLYSVGFGPVCGTQQAPANCIYIAGAGGTLRMALTTDLATWCDVGQNAGAVRLGGHMFQSGPNDIQLAGYNGTVLLGGNVNNHCPTPTGTFNKLATGTTTNLLDFSPTTDAGFRWISGANGTVLAQRFAQGDTSCNSGTSPVARFDAQTTGTTANLNGVNGGTNSNLWAVGSGGTIIHSAFAGSSYTDTTQCTPVSTSWAAQTSGTTQDLNDVRVLNDANGNAVEEFVVGNKGTILHSTNLGANWAAQPSGTCVNLHQVELAANGETSAFVAAYAVGDNGTILKYDPAGNPAASVNCGAAAAAAAPSPPGLPAAGIRSGSAWVLLVGALALAGALITAGVVLTAGIMAGRRSA